MIPQTIQVPTLRDVGTRYQHLADLVETWENGLAAINNSLKTYGPNDKDAKMKTNLDAAVSLVRSQMALLGRYEQKKWELRDEMNRIPKKPEGWVAAPEEEKKEETKAETKEK